MAASHAGTRHLGCAYRQTQPGPSMSLEQRPGMCHLDPAQDHRCEKRRCAHLPSQSWTRLCCYVSGLVVYLDWKGQTFTAIKTLLKRMDRFDNIGVKSGGEQSLPLGIRTSSHRVKLKGFSHTFSLFCPPTTTHHMCTHVYTQNHTCTRTAYTRPCPSRTLRPSCTPWLSCPCCCLCSV